MEAIHCGCLRVLLPLDVSVLCFDFCGSGLSEGSSFLLPLEVDSWNDFIGEYVSLGWFERQDLEEVSR